MTNTTVCSRAPGVFLLMLKCHIETITYLQIDQTNEHMMAKAAPAEERLCCLQILVIGNIKVPSEAV